MIFIAKGVKKMFSKIMTGPRVEPATSAGSPELHQTQPLRWALFLNIYPDYKHVMHLLQFPPVSAVNRLHKKN